MTGDSRIPSNFKDKYSDFFVSVSFSDAYLCSISNDSLIFFFVFESLIRIKFQGWEKPTDGAWWAAFRILVKTCSSMGSEVNLELTSLLE